MNSILLALVTASCATQAGQGQQDRQDRTDGGSGGAGGAVAETGGTGGTATGGMSATGGSATGGMSATGGTSFSTDSFENGAGQWLTRGGGTANVTVDGSHVYDLSDPTSKVFLAAAGDVAWTDVTVTAKVKIVSWAGSSSSDYAGLCARVADADDYTCVILRGDGKAAIRADVSGSSSTLGSTVSANLAAGTWYTVALRIDGTGVVASLDGAVLLPKAGEAPAAPGSPTGGIGLIVANAEAEFDDVTVNR